MQRNDCVWDALGRFPRLVTSQVSLSMFYRWMRCREWLDRPGCLFLRLGHLGHRETYTFTRFKLGCHRLAIVTGLNWPLAWHGPCRQQGLRERSNPIL